MNQTRFKRETNMGTSTVAVQRIFTEYTRLREKGKDARTALDALRGQIEQLSEADRQQLGRYVRAHEAGDPIPGVSMTGVPEKTEPTRTAPVRNIAKKKLSGMPNPSEGQSEIAWLNCPHCGKSNQKHEVVCYACGQLLEPPASEFETRSLAETNDLAYGNDFYDQNTTLVLQVRGAEKFYHLRPQDSDHEMVIGRTTAGSAVVPDIDVAPLGGDKLGVSRLHLTLRFDAKTHTLNVFDLGSSNGSYINGQRLHPHEVRVLHDGDELRLGKMVLTVRFKHDD
jgi:hypothetical protein